MRPTLPPKHCTLPLQLHVCNYQVWFRVLGPYISISSVVVWCFFLTLQFFFFISPYISYHKIKLRLDDAFVVIYLTRPEKHFSRISSLSLSHNSHFYTNYWYNQWLIQIFIIKVTQNLENFSSKGQFFWLT